jgi:hypothetical protein
LAKNRLANAEILLQLSLTSSASLLIDPQFLASSSQWALKSGRPPALCHRNYINYRCKLCCGFNDILETIKHSFTPEECYPRISLISLIFVILLGSREALMPLQNGELKSYLGFSLVPKGVYFR